MDLRTAMDGLYLGAADVGSAFGLSIQSVRQMRLDPSAAGYRSPPKGWEAILARLGRERLKQVERTLRALET